ncbi:hypothetical protein [Hathewaya massiliensis]|uniref:hypothetical protein n=1 Tax=Hathewaya massiliensis TaxID=1964382 RepID=UPI001158A046|nr:hypothetical protein [Hathewaya massiliensis]
MLLNAGVIRPNRILLKVFKNNQDKFIEYLKKIEDSEKVVWVTKGEPNFINRYFSGMSGKRGEASVTFEIEETRVRKANGLGKRIFGGKLLLCSQLVIEGDVQIPKDARFKFKNDIK